VLGRSEQALLGLARNGKGLAHTHPNHETKLVLSMDAFDWTTRHTDQGGSRSTGSALGTPTAADGPLLCESLDLDVDQLS
jgi:hypothetical protein